MVNFLKEIQETIIDRFKSPFIGAFVIVTLVFHWELVLIIFIGSSYPEPTTKIKLVKEYIGEYNWWYFILTPALLTVLSLFFLIIFNSIGLALKIVWERYLSVFIMKLLDDTRLVSKAERDEVFDRLKRIENENETLSLQNSSLSEENKSLKSEVGNLKVEKEHSSRWYNTSVSNIFGDNTTWKKIIMDPVSREKVEENELVFHSNIEKITDNDNNEVDIEFLKESEHKQQIEFSFVRKNNRLKVKLYKENDGLYFGIESPNIVIFELIHGKAGNKSTN